MMLRRQKKSSLKLQSKVNRRYTRGKSLKEIKKARKHNVYELFYYSASETTVKRSFICFGFSISSSAATAKSS